MRPSLLVAFLAPSLFAQSPSPTSNPSVRTALDIIKADNAWTLQQQMELTEIASPPFKESARAAEFKKRLEVFGVTNVRIDSVGNVIAERAGIGDDDRGLARWTEPRAAAAKLSLVVDTMGIRPTGAQSDAAPIVQTALNAAKALGFTSSTSASSTDANLPISLGIAAIRLEGGGTGGGSHSLGEWYSDGPNGWLGPQWAALVVAALAGVR
jgi:hypothetical protein